MKIKCEVCGYENFNEFLELRDYYYSREKFKILICDKCGFKITHPKVNEKDIIKYYDTRNYISHNNKQDSLFEKVYNFIKQYSFKNKLRLIKKYTKISEKNNLLDYGCANGDFLKFINNNNIKGFGLEINEFARQYAKNKNNLSNIFNPEYISNFENNKFSAITLWHVLEHIHNLDLILNEFYRILNKDGIIIIAVPNTDSYDCKHYKEFWAAYDVPRHLYHFSENNIIELMNRYNFKYIKKHPLIFDSFYISLVSEKYTKNKFKTINSILIGLISDIYGLFKNQYSSQIYIFKK